MSVTENMPLLAGVAGGNTQGNADASASANAGNLAETQAKKTRTKTATAEVVPGCPWITRVGEMPACYDSDKNEDNRLRVVKDAGVWLWVPTHCVGPIDEVLALVQLAIEAEEARKTPLSATVVVTNQRTLQMTRKVRLAAFDPSVLAPGDSYVVSIRNGDFGFMRQIDRTGTVEVKQEAATAQATPVQVAAQPPMPAPLLSVQDRFMDAMIARMLAPPPDPVAQIASLLAVVEKIKGPQPQQSTSDPFKTAETAFAFAERVAQRAAPKEAKSDTVATIMERVVDLGEKWLTTPKEQQNTQLQAQQPATAPQQPQQTSTQQAAQPGDLHKTPTIPACFSEAHEQAIRGIIETLPKLAADNGTPAADVAVMRRWCSGLPAHALAAIAYAAGKERTIVIASRVLVVAASALDDAGLVSFARVMCSLCDWAMGDGKAKFAVLCNVMQADAQAVVAALAHTCAVLPPVEEQGEEQDDKAEQPLVITGQGDSAVAHGTTTSIADAVTGSSGGGA